MAQVGIQGFRTRHAQHHSAQNDEAGAGLVPHEHQRVVRAHRPQNFRVPVDVKHAQHRQGHEPHQRDGPKKLADAACAALLHRKRQNSTTSVRGMTYFLKCGDTTSSPSTAESTEMAG